MANSSVLFADLKAGLLSSTIELRLLRFWEATNGGGELMGVDKHLLDAQICDQNTAELFPDDNDNIYEAEETYESTERVEAVYPLLKDVGLSPDMPFCVDCVFEGL
uniref:Uncharacterized protein n=1 Tax=Brassica campestris TaxID=3711 RepID=M4DLG3_BRACM